MVALVLVLAIAGVLWAKHESKGAKATGISDWARCTKTCSTLMQLMARSHARVKVHEGDKQCWQTCWNRMGKGATRSAARMKAFWTQNSAKHMRANQCAQACWRMHHDNTKMVQVKDWRSEPRDTICAK
jgi:hypothetical protein